MKKTIEDVVYIDRVELINKTGVSKSKIDRFYRNNKDLKQQTHKPGLKRWYPQHHMYLFNNILSYNEIIKLRKKVKELSNTLEDPSLYFRSANNPTNCFKDRINYSRH